MTNGTDAASGRASKDKEAGEVARLLSYVAILAVSVWLFFEAGTLPTSRWDVLGAGAFPQLVFGVLGLLALTALVGALRRASGTAVAGFGSATLDWLKRRYLVVCLLAFFGLYLVLLPVFGFSPATFVFLLATQLVLMPRSVKTVVVALVIALAFSFGMNELFSSVFNVFLPRGGL